MLRTRREVRALALIVVVVVLIILLVLVALLLPATQSARVVARRAQVINNLKQLGLALQSYSDKGTPETTSAGPAGAETTQGAPSAAVARKIVYNAEVDLTVEHFSTAEQELIRLVREHGGYLASVDQSGSPDMPRAGTWKVRVPVDRFDAFVAAVVKLGELQHRLINSQDVTEEYYDVEARIKNKAVEEARLIKHLEESTGKLKDILDVERELSRVREEIERQQGRLQLLANLTSLTNVTVVFNELDRYRPLESPGFAVNIARTFHSSLDHLIEFGKNLVLIAVAVAPWLPLAALIGVPVWLIVRRRVQQAAARPGATPAALGAG